MSVRKLLLKALDESQHGLPSKGLSGTSFDFVVWKNESNQPHVSGRTLITHKLHLFGNRWLMSALPPKADIRRLGCDVRFVPIADIR